MNHTWSYGMVCTDPTADWFDGSDDHTNQAESSALLALGLRNGETFSFRGTLPHFGGHLLPILFLPWGLDTIFL